VAWGQKATVEYHARLTLWRNFLEDYREQPGANADRYPYEVARRVMLHLLEEEAQGIPTAETNLVKAMDKLLQAVFVPGEFIWDPELQGGFPRDTYWYLFGRLKT
jgi:hypothetical protein